MSRFKGKPVGGLPGRLPPGETILWQGRPRWQSLAIRAFRIKLVALYFGLLVFWRISGALAAGHGLRYGIESGLSGIILGAVAIGIFTGYAWLISRSSSYTITDRRVVITCGMAIPKALNLPFSTIESADMAMQPDGTGNFLLRLPEATKISYLLLWPHVQAGKKARPVPMLRAVVEPRLVAGILAQALADSQGGSARVVTTSAAPEAALPVPHGVAA